MSKRYIVTIMDRHYLGDETFIYSCNRACIGEIDQETGLFIDDNGNEYANMLSEELRYSEIPYSYTNVMAMSDLKDAFDGALPMKEAIKEYEYQCGKNLFYVSRTEDEGKPYVITINKDNFESLATEISESMDYTEDEEEMDSELKQLIIDVVNGEYSLEELREIRKQIQLGFEDIECVLDTLDLQIEASEKGESFVKLAAEKQGQESDISEDAFDVWKEVMEPSPEEKKETKKSESKKERIDIEDLFNKVTKTLIAQDEPARRVIAEIARKEMDKRKKKEGILLTGATGVGKTELMRLIAKYLDRPFYKIDSTQLTIPGYTGKDIEEFLWDLYLSCGKDKEKAENAIIFFDEIDKKGSSKKSDVSGQGVLNILLPFIEGTSYDACLDTKSSIERVKIDTSNMIVILGGAYTDVYKNLLEKNGIGFNSSVSAKDTYRKATTEDFVKKGMMTDEFMGRVTVIKLNDLDVDALVRIMRESDESAIKIQEHIFDELGVKITFTDGYTKAIAEDAEKKKTGARGLNGIIDETTWQAFEEVYKNPDMYSEVILNEETARDPSRYKLIIKGLESDPEYQDKYDGASVDSSAKEAIEEGNHQLVKKRKETNVH